MFGITFEWLINMVLGLRLLLVWIWGNIVGLVWMQVLCLHILGYVGDLVLRIALLLEGVVAGDFDGLVFGFWVFCLLLVL